MTTAADHLARAVRAHRESLDAQAAMRVAAVLRDAAVRDAHASGCTMQQIADALGISRGRVNHIIHPIPKKPKT